MLIAHEMTAHRSLLIARSSQTNVVAPYRSEIKELEKKLNNNKWRNANGTPLTWKKLCNKNRHLFTDFHTLKGKLEMEDEINKPRSVSKGGTNPSRSHNSRP